MERSVKDILHEKFNPRSDQVAPVRIKGFDRVGLAKLFAELGYTKGAEVGTAQGLNAVTLCENIPGLHLSCIDPWLKYKANPRAHPQEEQDRCYQLTQERLADYDVELLKGMSMDRVREFDDESLDFVYIDGHHGFDYVMQDLIEWSKKVRPGGIISGHDYYRFRWAGVVDAVNAYTNAHKIREWFVDDVREISFFWAKP